MKIVAYDRIGLRVTNRARSLAFYEALGFRLEQEHSTETALELVNAAGVRLNLIQNGESTSQWPGYTHAAFIVDNLSDVLTWAGRRQVAITEGPVDSGRRLTCFLRDPDSNVLEFNELKSEPGVEARYTLVLGQKNYSSWSMRAWLLLKMLGVPFREITVPVYRSESREAVRALGGQTGLVPVLVDGSTTIWDTLAIFEYLYERFPDVWPSDRSARARARSISGEIHSGFNALRAAMPVNTRARGRRVQRTPEVNADIERTIAICNERGGGSPWLFSTFSGADVMFAPIATRFQTYDVMLEGPTRDYMERLLRHPHVAEWLRLGREESDVIEFFELGQ